MHKNSRKAIKWKGEKSELFEEQQGVRQGSTGAATEYVIYTSQMLAGLESAGANNTMVPIGASDTIAGHPVSVVAVADDTAPSARHSLPRVALSDLQVLLYATEDEAKQLHIDFNVQKCQLLITAKPGKMRKTMEILKSEPDVLTFYGQPVTLIKPGEYYVHLGVPQAPTNQSSIAVTHRVKDGMEKYYLLQDVVKNSLQGINPSANKYILNTYVVHGFIYGLDTISINPTNLDTLETKYRSILRSVQSLPPSTPTPLVYLLMGCMPAVAIRDIQILQLVGQLAMCDRELQNVSDIVEYNLAGENIEFQGWSGPVSYTHLTLPTTPYV